MRDIAKGRRLFFISALFMVLLNFPVLSIFNSGATVSGVPVLYLYLTVVWLVCIVAIAFFINRQDPRKQKK
ncbi:hypothetical protein [Pontibacter ramchanderi]|uniref:DUF3311 domain-containing protein n=1 Tax=Pontibacter ramchanderi TaxID=1179743 RepID=A0A2N3UAS7_9BACT|nr:hypothetical protein [Pontibacter ramchanderi]PKV66500.1 hypothetical protein BD749_1629 [Pontibacter ramchanderi]